jgi:hypothetical protein
MVNNIIAFNTGPQVGEPTALYLGSGVTLIEHHNLYFSKVDEEITAEFLGMEISRQAITDGTWSDLTNQGQGDIIEDPMFLAGWPDVNLSLQPGSPAIDTGDSNSCPSEDVYGNPRPLGSGCDLGAIEQQ